MITYTLSKEQYKKCAGEYVKKQAVIGVVLAACSILVGVFFLLVGLLDDKEALNNAYTAFFASFMFIVGTVVFYYAKLNRGLEWFQKKFHENVATFSLELQLPDFLIINVSCGNKYTIKFNEIDRIIRLKKYYGIIEGGGIFFVEKNEATKELIDQIVHEKK